MKHEERIEIMNLIIIAGLPATGKTTLANKIGRALGLPILEKDEIKEALFDTVGYGDREAKRKLDLAGQAVLMRCTEKVLTSGNSLIIVNNFDRNMSGEVQAMIDRTGCRCVTVFLNGDADILHKRYVERDRKHLRHAGHTHIDRYPPREGDAPGKDMSREYFAERFERFGMADFKLNGPRIDLDATHPENVDVEDLIRKIKEALQ
jgi:predicted kinase